MFFFRRRRSTSQSECVPTRYTKFCSSTEVHRNKVIDEITSMLDRKHYRCRNRTDVINALKGCFGDCGTCMEGKHKILFTYLIVEQRNPRQVCAK